MKPFESGNTLQLKQNAKRSFLNKKNEGIQKDGYPRFICMSIYAQNQTSYLKKIDFRPFSIATQSPAITPSIYLL